MKRRTLAQFIKPYKDTAIATGAMEPPDLTTPAPDKLARDERLVEPLPELKTGDQLKSRKGLIYRVVRVNKPKRDTGFSEPLFRLERANILGHFEWTLDELSAEKMEIIT